MQMAEGIRRLWAHARWADQRLLAALRGHDPEVPAALRELAHVAGTAEVWLARLEGRIPRAVVWPVLAPEALDTLLRETHDAYGRVLGPIEAGDLDASVTYTNSAGRTFTNRVGDILLHVAMHGQYHRGKINLLIRQRGWTPEPADYIAFVRGAPAATDAAAREWFRDR